MKKCNRCLQELDEVNFYKSSDAKDGLYTICKSCCKKRDQSKRENNPLWHQYQIDRAKKYHKENKDKILERKKKYLQTPNGRESNRKQSRRFKEKYPDKIKSHNAIYSAVKKGKIFKPNFCTVCAVKGPVEAHHANYESEARTIVTWVCKMCHTIIERKIKNGSTINL